VLVWSKGKVGSSSVCATLRQYGFDAVQVHYLSDLNLTYLMNETYCDQILPDNIVASLRVLHGIDRGFYKPPFRVVTLVRDPLARNVSAYFQNLQHFSGARALDAEAHVRRFLDTYPHSVALDWFDTDLRAVTGVDFRERAFDRDRGWSVWRSERFHLLLLRTEQPDEVKLRAMSEFIGAPITHMIRDNEAVNKDYGDLYTSFMRAFAAPRAYLDYLYDSDLCAKFWRPEDVRRMKSAWRICDQPLAESARPAIASSLASS
jgi:Putative capsular polysaccharide synthesis protein